MAEYHKFETYTKKKQLKTAIKRSDREFEFPLKSLDLYINEIKKKKIGEIS